MNRPHPTSMLRIVVRILAPLLQLYGLYVLFHGHYSPGGGFQAGVILASSYVLIGLGLGRDALERRVSERTLAVAAAAGVAVFVVVAAAPVAFGGAVLDYGAIAALSEDVAGRRSAGILLVEAGVAVTVAAVIVLMFMRLADPEEI